MVTTYSSPEELLEKVYFYAYPFLQRWLFDASSNVTKTGLKTIDRLIEINRNGGSFQNLNSNEIENINKIITALESQIDRSYELTKEYEPFEIFVIRNLYAALKIVRDGDKDLGYPRYEHLENVAQRYQHLLEWAPGSKNDIFGLALELNDGEDETLFSIYQDLLGLTSVNKKIVLTLALNLFRQRYDSFRQRYDRDLFQLYRCLIFCEGNDTGAAQVVDRFIEKISKKAGKINASEHLRENDPVFMLDGNPPGIATDDDDFLNYPFIYPRYPFCSLLLESLSEEAKKVWVLERVEDIAVDADEKYRERAIHSFWCFISQFKWRYLSDCHSDNSVLQLWKWEMDTENINVECSHMDIPIKDVFFLIRTAVDRQALKALIGPKLWNGDDGLKQVVFEFAPKPGIGDTDFN